MGKVDVIRERETLLLYSSHRTEHCAAHSRTDTCGRLLSNKTPAIYLIFHCGFRDKNILKRNSNGACAILLSCWLFLLLSVFTSNIQASAIGLPTLPESTTSPISIPPPTPGPFASIKIGLGLNVSLSSINDEQGDTKNKAFIQPGSLFITDTFLYETHYLAEFFFSRYSFQAEPDKTGVQSSNIGTRFSVQFNAKHHVYFSPKYGAGFEFSYGKYTQRFRVDNDGFLVEQYEDLSKIGVNLIFNMMQTWPLSPQVEIGAKVEYRLPLTQTVNGFSGSILLLYHPKF